MLETRMSSLVIQVHASGISVVRAAQTDDTDRPSIIEHAADMPLFPRTTEDVAPLLDLISSVAPSTLSHPASITLVLPATWVLFGEVPARSRSGSADAAIFAFEQQVPFSLEELACIASPTDSGKDRILATLREPLRFLIEGLEARQVQIEAVVVDAVIKLPEIDGRESISLILDDNRMSVVIPETATPETILLPPRSEPLQRSKHIAASIHRIRTIDGMPENAKWHVLALGASESSRDLEDLRTAARSELTHHDRCTWLEHAARRDSLTTATNNLLSGPLGTLQRKRIARFAAKKVLIGAVVVFLAILVSTEWKIRQANSQRAGVLERQTEVFRSISGEDQLPPAAPRLLASRRRLLEAQTSTSTNAEHTRPEGLAAVRAVAEVVDAIPSDVKIRIQRMSVAVDGIQLSGRTTDHDAAGRIVQGVNTHPGWSADPPQTKLLPDGTVEFHAHVRAEEE